MNIYAHDKERERGGGGGRMKEAGGETRKSTPTAGRPESRSPSRAPPPRATQVVSEDPGPAGGAERRWKRSESRWSADANHVQDGPARANEAVRSPSEPGRGHGSGSAGGLGQTLLLTSSGRGGNSTPSPTCTGEAVCTQRETRPPQRTARRAWVLLTCV